LTHRPDTASALRGGANWDDLRFVLAVAETGSVSAAARRLGVNHATVLRRIAAYEAAEGAAIFDRGPQGYAVPPDKLRVIEAAREAAAAMQAVGRALRGGGSALAGTIRVTSTDTLCLTVLPGIAADLMRSARALSLELICANEHLDLSRFDADITVRPAQRLPPDLRGEPAGQLGFAPYAISGAPDLWLVPGGTLARSPAATWIEAEIDPDHRRPGADSFAVLRAMAGVGLGRAVLPVVLGQEDRRLVRLDFLPPVAPVPLWVASHADLADTPRLRQCRARLAAALKGMGDQLADAA
jgi:DNA-binding transcriptional LysR family regulator